jgi:mitochondrial enoyl-[acyl-carrier protein] reductase / trans-2-enoyl-CoA reductase
MRAVLIPSTALYASWRRFASTAANSVPYSLRQLTVHEHGSPIDVLRLEEEERTFQPIMDSVLVKMVFAPINPADINVIQGSYKTLPPLPAVPGGEGVGEVIAVGPDVSTLKVGDPVFPAASGAGTWRSHIEDSENAFVSAPSGLTWAENAALRVNPPTAWRMLHDFGVPERMEDRIFIQNASNSSVGRSALQLGKMLGWKSVNLIRGTGADEGQELKEELEALGADIVITERELMSQRAHVKSAIVEKLGKLPLLALNCVGGPSLTEMSRLLAPGASVVTYGGMSRKPVTVSTSAFIFEDLKMFGFWMTRWRDEHSLEEQQEMYESLATAIRKGQLILPEIDFFGIDEYMEVLGTPSCRKRGFYF